ncbi:hypothetical protein J0910_29560 [Nocardiopsis sp. CNT-189]|uniref:hypothetical protein n=1 Tax=Nocardiopsis oceanisediminis TaxID=2816862 RepID=UPI003B317FE4
MDLNTETEQEKPTGTRPEDRRRWWWAAPAAASLLCLPAAWIIWMFLLIAGLALSDCGMSAPACEEREGAYLAAWVLYIAHLAAVCAMPAVWLFPTRARYDRARWAVIALWAGTLLLVLLLMAGM